MPRPTREMAAVGSITRGSQSCPRSRSRLRRSAGSRTLASGSSETVTLVSEVEMASTEIPWRAKQAKTSARKPTACHIPTVSREISVMPLRVEIALTSGSVPGPDAEITVPGASGRRVQRTCSGILW